MNDDINTIQDEIVSDCSTFNDWFDTYDYLIQQGNNLKSAEETLKHDDNSIGGCQSNVWIKSNMNDGKIRFDADSDSLIIKGILSLILRVVNDQHPEDVANIDLYFIDKIGLTSNLSPTRANGLHAIVKRIKTSAEEYTS